MNALPSTLNNQQRGAAFEEMLDWQHAIYSASNRALVYRNGLRATVKSAYSGGAHSKRGIGAGGAAGAGIAGSGPRAILTKARPDYEGVLTTLGGKHVAFDAKLTAKTTYYHPTDRMHQLRDLWDVSNAGGVAFLLVSIQMDRFFVLWPQPEWQFGKHERVKLGELRGGGIGVEVPLAGGYSLPDWLNVVERAA